jgi:hypothetical protein
MDSHFHKIIFIILFVLIISAILTKQDVEAFGIMDIVNSPGRWVGDQVGGVWGGIKGPAVFARDVYYNMFPNYTMITRYFDKKNDYIRANKGLPITRPLRGKINLNYNVERKDKDTAYKFGLGKNPVIGKSILNSIV